MAGVAAQRWALFERRNAIIAVMSVAAIVLHLVLRFGLGTAAWAYNLPLWAALALGGVPLVWDLLRQLVKREFGSDLLAGISIVTSVLLEEYLAGTLVVLMLSGGGALESVCRAQRLVACSKRWPGACRRTAHVRRGTAAWSTWRWTKWPSAIALVVLPHEICPVDGTVVEGHGVMDESYLTGEPYMMSKTPGSPVLSGAINGESALTIEAARLAVDSRYAKIMQVMQSSASSSGRGFAGWATSSARSTRRWRWRLPRLRGSPAATPTRFLAVLVVATPCPLLIAIPVAIIGSISLAARRGIIIKDPAVLEQVEQLPRRDSRQDRHADLRRAAPGGAARCAGIRPGGRALAGGQPGALLEASAGRGDRRGGPKREGLPLVEAAPVSEAPGEGLRGHGRRARSVDHQPHSSSPRSMRSRRRSSRR